MNKYALFALLVNERSAIVSNKVKSKISPVPANSSIHNHISVSECPTDPQDKNFSQRRLYPHWLKNCILLLKLRTPPSTLGDAEIFSHPASTFLLEIWIYNNMSLPTPYSGLKCEICCNYTILGVDRAPFNTHFWLP